VDQRDDGLWYATFETDGAFETPAQSITALLGAIESLDEATQRVWRDSITRDFNIGYDAGATPRVVEHEIAADVLARIASVRASLHITIYATS
jgi:hypothetical protein